MRAWLELVRIPAIFTAPADVLFGVGLAAFIGAQIGPEMVVLLVLASALVYAAGMAANDIFDVRIDTEERPSRPIPSGRVSYRSAWALVAVLQTCACALAWSIGTNTLIAVAVTIGATYLYNSVLKGSFMAPMGMGVCRYANALIGLSIAGPTVFEMPEVLCAPLGTFVYVSALTFVSTFEVGGESQVVQRKRAFVTVLIAAGLASVPTLLVFDVSYWAMPAVTLPVIWIYPEIRKAWLSSADSQTRMVVIRCIHGIAIVNGVLAGLVGQWLLGAAIVALILPARFVGRRFYAT